MNNLDNSLMQYTIKKGDMKKLDSKTLEIIKVNKTIKITQN